MPQTEATSPLDREGLDVYHARIESALPSSPAYVMPKLRGSCVQAVFCDGRRVVHTRDGFDGPDVRATEQTLGDATWDDGITLAFQSTNAHARIQLVYGADTRTGLELDYATLERLAETIRVPLIKRQLVRGSAKRVMSVVRAVDDVETIAQVKEGIVVVDAAGKRHEIRSWHDAFVFRRTVPSKSWLATLVREASSIDALHEAVEAVDGPLDAAVLARRMLVDLIVDARSKPHATDADALSILVAAVTAA